MAVDTLPQTYAWRNYEFGYCLNLIRTKGNEDVGRDPCSSSAQIREL